MGLHCTLPGTGDKAGIVVGDAAEDMGYTELNVATRMYILSLGIDFNDTVEINNGDVDMEDVENGDTEMEGTFELGDGGAAGKYGESASRGVGQLRPYTGDLDQIIGWGAPSRPMQMSKPESTDFNVENVEAIWNR